MTASTDRFRDLHASGCFVMPNPFDIGSARLLDALGFPALATTSAGFAATLGRDDMQVTRDELVAHVAAISAASLAAPQRRLGALLRRHRRRHRRDGAPAGRRRRRGVLDRGLEPGDEQHRRHRRGHRACARCGDGSGRTRAGAHRSLREPPARCRRLRRHPGPAGRLPRGGRGGAVRPAVVVGRAGRRGRGARGTGQRAAAAGRTDASRSWPRGVLAESQWAARWRTSPRVRWWRAPSTCSPTARSTRTPRSSPATSSGGRSPWGDHSRCAAAAGRRAAHAHRSPSSDSDPT